MAVNSALCLAVVFLTTNLYVADRATEAVIAFDAGGTKIAQYNAKAAVFDVVTDRRGHVYVIYGAHNGTDEVKELSHDLSRVIATYRPGGIGFNLAIDANDNLYVGHATQSGASIYEYHYGSTRLAAIYPLRFSWPRMLGISVRNGIIYSSVQTPFRTYSFFACTVGSIDSCRLRYEITGAADCGLTSTGSDVEVTWFGSPFTVRKLDTSRFRQVGKLDLPSGYAPGWASFCALHDYRDAVWLPVLSSSKSESLAIEMDMRRGAVLARIGAGTLRGPVAAFYGNGFTP